MKIEELRIGQEVWVMVLSGRNLEFPIILKGKIEKLDGDRGSCLIRNKKGKCHYIENLQYVFDASESNSDQILESATYVFKEVLLANSEDLFIGEGRLERCLK